MTDEEKKIILNDVKVDLLKQILEEQKKQTIELENIKNIFLKYDNEELLNDENIRMG